MIVSPPAVEFACSGCRSVIAVPILLETINLQLSPDEAIEMAKVRIREAGWLVGHSGNLCPRCSATPDGPELVEIIAREPVAETILGFPVVRIPAPPPIDPDCLARAREVASRQAEDTGRWFLEATATEAYLQAALRELHEAIEGKSQAECASDALSGKATNS